MRSVLYAEDIFRCSRMNRFYFRVLLGKKTDNVKKLMTAQDSLRVAAVRGSIQTVANFNKCNINVFILLIIFSAN